MIYRHLGARAGQQYRLAARCRPAEYQDLAAEHDGFGVGDGIRLPAGDPGSAGGRVDLLDQRCEGSGVLPAGQQATNR